MANELTLTVRITREQLAWLKDEAEEIEESVSWIVRDLIDQARMSDEGE